MFNEDHFDIHPLCGLECHSLKSAKKKIDRRLCQYHVHSWRGVWQACPFCLASGIMPFRYRRSIPLPHEQKETPPSRALLDPLPSIPTAEEPHQRVIGKIDRSALTMYIQILASSDYTISNSPTGLPSANKGLKTKGAKSAFIKARPLGDRVVIKQKRSVFDTMEGSGPEEQQVSRETKYRLILAEGISEVTHDALVKKELSIADFRPLRAPFVPHILNILVNSIETDCYMTGWEPVFASYPGLRETAQLHACLLIQNWNHHHHIRRQIASLSLPMKIATFRVLLAGFKQKPLHFSKKVLLEVIKRPLFDQFLRPNPKIKSLVRHTALPCNRTQMDTLAFLMFHLQHAWEYGSNPMTAKIKLAKLYGPLIVSFSERPEIIDQDPSDYKTEEAAILEVVLEVCNSQFWDNLSMLKMHLAFQSKAVRNRSKEQKSSGDGAPREANDTSNFEHNSLPVEDSVAETSDMPSEYQNEDWFSYLFPLDLIRIPTPPPTPPTPIMPWEHNMFETCRTKPRKVEVVRETAAERIKRCRDAIGEHLHGSLLDWTPPKPPLAIDIRHPKSVGYADGRPRAVHHVYCRRQLRSTEAILRDVLYTSSVGVGQRTRQYLARARPRVQSRSMVASMCARVPLLHPSAKQELHTV